MTKVFKIGVITSLALILISFCNIVFAENTLTDVNMNLQSNKTTNSNTVDKTTTQVSSGSNTSNEDLGIGHIINILLIVVGIVLILLAIAILIRLR